MQENKNQRNELEMGTQNQASPTDRSLYRIKTIPLDGPNKGIPTYQSVYHDPRVPALLDQLGWAEAENKRLRAELDRYKASGRIVNTTYTIAPDPESERCGVKVYRVKLDEEFREICDDEIDHLQRLLRSQSSGCVGKVFLDDMTAYFAKEYLSLSREETVAKIRLAGDAVDSATAWIRTVRELLQVFERNVTKIRLVYPPSDWYGAKIRQLASSMNLKEYGMLLVCAGLLNLYEALIFVSKLFLEGLCACCGSPSCKIEYRFCL